MSPLDSFVRYLHPSTKILDFGSATVLEHRVPAVRVKNLYGQILIWGMFGVERGKFKGKLANNASTEDVTYIPTKLIGQ